MDRGSDDGGETYRFRHLLIRDAAYDSLPKAERAEMHERFADWLDRTAGDRLAELDEITGYHLDQARTYRLALGPDDDRTRALALRAGRRLAAAGQRAADRDEVVPAVRLLTRAGDLLAEDPATRFATLLRLLDVGFQVDYAATLRSAHDAETVGAQIGELAALRARLWVSSARAMTDPDFRVSDTRAEAEAAVRAFSAAGDVDGLLDCYVLMIIIDLNVAHWRETATSARLGLDLATRAGREGQRGEFAGWLSNALLWGSTDASESLATIEALLGSTSRRLSRALMLSTNAVLRGILGDRAAAEAAETEAQSIRDELGHRRSEFRHADMEYALGDFPTALRLARAEAEDLERRGDTGQRSTMVGLAAWLLVLMGDDDEAAHAAAEESRHLSAPDDAVSQILWRAAEGVVLARRGQAAESELVTSEAIAIADTTDSMDAGSAWLARAHALSISGRPTEATEAARQARGLYAAKGFVNAIRWAEALIVE